ncbi:MAG: hypothetical protein OMM_05964 [Candidatus Magnetoglobus multicellularis str. Araruama]|uniref:DUF1156 domain-containing protein n=1 Tax=Candidatus Magnetoglobus multicellularis str. Araruama TaxID=890399 RepID=A0A1V1NSW5_9BACT|nr:MAG: hypothetical protein OMM_05964 [Candidatus Magnetoglobus multicellularis str. Araruama]
MGGYFYTKTGVITLYFTKKLKELPIDEKDGLNLAIRVCLALAIDRQADICSSVCRWLSLEAIANTFSRQAISFVTDFAEGNPFSGATGSWEGAVEWIVRFITQESHLNYEGVIERVSVNEHPLPNDSVEAVITDPPYYDAISYADLSDFFYVWLRRSIGSFFSDLFYI